MFVFMAHFFFLVVDIQCSNLDEGDTKAAERSSEKVRCAFLDLQLRMFGYITDFRESSVMIYELLNIPSQSLSTGVILVDGI